MSTVSVVMPYYENQRTLAASLQSFCQQTLPPLEIVVVDDGSPQPAAPIVTEADWPIEIRVLHHDHGGQSAATNQGILAARGDIVLLTCADILADERLVEVHAATHGASDDALGVLGYIPYAAHIPRTPFMEYLSGDGPQFRFGEIHDPEHVEPEYLYAPNFSVRRDRLLLVGGFDPDFVYGFQDTDLGRRLTTAGVRFVYRADAVGHHDHPNSLRAFVRRQRFIGTSACLFLRKHPSSQAYERARTIVKQSWPMVRQLPRLLADIERLEQRVARMPRLPASVRDQLYNLYSMAITISLVEGIMQQPQQARDVLGLDLDNLPEPPAC